MIHFTGALGAAHLDEVLEAHTFEYGVLQIQIVWRIEVESVLFLVEKPFAGSIELFKDVFDKTIFRVHGEGAVVLPAAFVGEVAARVLAGDFIVQAAPQVLVEGVDVAAARIGPPLGALRADGVGCSPVEVLGAGLVVGIARENLALSVGEELIGVGTGRDGRLQDAVLVGGPAGFQERTAAERDQLVGVGRVENGRFGRAGVFGAEHERLGKVIGTGAEVDGDGAEDSFLQCSNHVFCGMKGLKWKRFGAGIGVAAVGADEEAVGRIRRRCGAGEGPRLGKRWVKGNQSSCCAEEKRTAIDPVVHLDGHCSPYFSKVSNSM